MNENHNPWKILDNKHVYENNWIQLNHYSVINPSGGKGVYGKIHFKNYALGILPLDDNLNTYLVGQYRFTLNRYSWEICEGGCPFDEDKLEGAKRELLEETGLQALHWEKIIDFDLSNSITDESGSIYLATGLSHHAPMPEETEQLVIKKLPFEEVYDMVEKGVITDMISVTAILKVKLMLMNKSMVLK